MKECFKCGAEKPLTQFYKHKAMADGHLNKCKACAKMDVQKNRLDKVEYYREYDRKRHAEDPVRRSYNHAHSAAWRKSNPKRHAELTREWSIRNPEKRRAHSAVNNAIRGGKLIKPTACESCGENNVAIHGHHHDYSKPLDVEWLCPQCHSDRHK